MSASASATASNLSLFAAQQALDVCNLTASGSVYLNALRVHQSGFIALTIALRLTPFIPSYIFPPALLLSSNSSSFLVYEPIQAVEAWNPALAATSSFALLFESYCDSSSVPHYVSLDSEI